MIANDKISDTIEIIGFSKGMCVLGNGLYQHPHNLSRHINNMTVSHDHDILTILILVKINHITSTLKPFADCSFL